MCWYPSLSALMACIRDIPADWLLMIVPHEWAGRSGYGVAWREWDGIHFIAGEDRCL